VARQLLAFVQEYGRPVAEGGIVIPLRLTQTDLAEMVGATRVHVNRVLSNFKKNRYLSEDHRHHITVHDRAALAEYCRNGPPGQELSANWH
jgi:CRP/FNR family transcriptional regulator